MNANIKIRKGAILVYRTFDIAEEINLKELQSQIQKVKEPSSFRVKRSIDRAIVQRSQPVALQLEAIDLNLDCGRFRADTTIKLRDYGVLTVIFEIALNPGTTWKELIALAVDLEEESQIDHAATRIAAQFAEKVSPALKRPTTWGTFEDYIVYFIESFEDETVLENIALKVDIPSLLLAEENLDISENTRSSIMENLFQYSSRDLAVIDWNSALVIDPSGTHDIPDILEFTLTHLLEMRYYDDLLDIRLNDLYDRVENKKKGVFGGQYSQLYQESSARYIEFSEFIERVENSLKVVGDFYLATIYRAATRRFRLGDWQQDITRKMNILAQVTELLQGEANIRRSHFLEITVIVLIAFEIVSAIVRYH